MAAIVRGVFLAGVLFATPALAGATLNQSTPGYTYFNKPGADLAAHAKAIDRCRDLAEATNQAGDAAAKAATDPHDSTGYWSREHNAGREDNHQGHLVNLENCMVVFGWRVVVLDPAQGQRLASESLAVRARQLADWVGADTPPGVVVRRFANDALDGSPDSFGFAVPRGTLLSIDDLAEPPEPGPHLDPDDPTASSSAPYAKRKLTPLGRDHLMSLRGDSGLVVVGLAGAGSFRLIFERVDADGQPPRDSKGADLTVAQPTTGGDVGGGAGVYAVPEGRWRLAAIARGRYSINFCLGAPSFSVANGQVVFAGQFDPASGVLAPTMNPEMALEALPAGSPLRQRLRPADWVNGSTGQCRGAYIYALEFPGRPFEGGYHLGSMAQPSAPSGR